MEKVLSCRVCLQVEELMVHIYDEMEDLQSDLSTLLSTCGGLKIDKNDSYPKYLCRECTGELLIAAKFREKCARTQKVLDEIDADCQQEQKDEESVKQQMTEETKIQSNDDSKNLETSDGNTFELEETIEMSDVDLSEALVPPQQSQEIIIEYENFENETDHDYTGDGVIVFEVENALEDSLESVIVEEEEEEENIMDKAEEEEVLAATLSIDLAYKEYQPRKAKTSDPLAPMSSASPHFVCDNCGAFFVQAANLKRHMDKTHQLTEQFTCDKCQHVFSLVSEYEKHVSICEHLDKTAHTSELVEKASPTRKRKRPAKDPSTTTGNAKKCDYCGKELRSAFALNMHLRTHTGERPFQCEHCPKSFKTQSSLSIHLKRHAGLPDHHCPVCQKTFYETSNLTAHMRTHTGEKPHACQICSKRFARVFLLQHHMRTHTGEKPYQCTMCENKRSFAQLSDLRNHIRGHTGERNHRCPVCPKTFIKRYPLLLHMKKHSSLGHVANSSETVEMELDESQNE